MAAKGGGGGGALSRLTNQLFSETKAFAPFSEAQQRAEQLEGSFIYLHAY